MTQKVAVPQEAASSEVAPESAGRDAGLPTGNMSLAQLTSMRRAAHQPAKAGNPAPTNSSRTAPTVAPTGAAAAPTALPGDGQQPGDENGQGSDSSETSDSTTELAAAADGTADATNEPSNGAQETAPGSELSAQPGAPLPGEEGQEAEGLPAGLESATSAELLAAIAELPAGNAKLIRRLHKAIDRRDAERNQRLALEREREQLQARVQELENGSANGGGGSVPVSADPAQNDPAVRALDQQLAHAKEILAWAKANPDGGEMQDKQGRSQHFDAEAVSRITADYEAKRIDLATERAATVQQVRSAHQQGVRYWAHQAVAEYPWMGNPESREFQMADAMLRQAPEFKRFPNYLMAVGDLVDKQIQRERRAKNGNGRPGAAVPSLPTTRARPATTPTSQVAGSAAAAPRVNGARKQAQESEQTFRKTGRTEDFAKALAAKRRARAEA